MVKLMHGKKIFDNKKIIIRKLANKDLKRVKEFQNFINSLIEENAKISMSKKVSLKEEKKWLEDVWQKTKEHQRTALIAEYNNKIIGKADVELDHGRMSHIGIFGISIIKKYRGIGLGKYLMKEILKLAKKELKPKPKIIRLSVYPNNKPAINLYKKFGFKKVARIPKQIQYKGKLIDEIVMLLELFNF